MTVNDPQLASGYAGSLLHTFDDFDHEPSGREIKARVYYQWNDYNPLDEPNPIWGAEPAKVEVLSVHVLNDQGEATAVDIPADLGARLIEQHREELCDLCTEDGYRNNVGPSPGWYAPASRAAKKLSIIPIGQFKPRMAPSQATKKGRQSKRKLG